MKTKSFRFTVEVVFSKPLNPSEKFKQEIATKINDAINIEAQYGEGITPNKVKVDTNIITVTPDGSSFTSKTIMY